MPTTDNVLIVDDTPHVVELVSRHLERHGYAIRSATRGSEALDQLRDGFQGVVVLDLNLPDYQALELFAEIRRINELLPVIIITAHGTIDMAIEAIRHGAFDFLPKTDQFLERLLIATTNATSQLNLKRKVKTLQGELTTRYNFDQIVTVSDAMKPVFELMQHAVQSRVTV